MKSRNTSLVLVVEDDRKISDFLLDYLLAAGFDAVALSNGSLALNYIENNRPDLLILDWMLPGMDGLSLCKEVRKFSEVPVLMLTAKIDEIDRISGLDSGADDYVCKPFSPRELVARVRALLRRSEGKNKESDSPWCVDNSMFRITWNGLPLQLTRLEFFMLRLLLSQPGRVFSRSQLLDCIHDRPKDISDRAIDTHIKNIRKKIQRIEVGSDYISSVYGVGYRIEKPKICSSPS